MSIDPENLSTRPFRVNTDGDVEMAQGRTFDTQGSRIVNLPAPASASEPQRAGDHVSHINIRAGGTEPVVINGELITQHGYNPEHTHVTVRFTQGGEKRVVLDTGAVGLLVTVYKSAAASSIVIEPGDGRTFRGSSAPVEVQPEVAAKRSFTIASIGDDWDFVGVPNIDGGVEGHMLDDGAVTTEKIASTALDGWGFGVSPAVPTPTAAEHAVRKDYVDDAHALFEAPLSGSGAADSKATIGAPTHNDGYSVASDEVTVPGPGLYRVQVLATLNNSSSSDLRPTGLSIRVAGAQLVQALGHRYGTATTGRVQVSGFKYVTITDPATQKISWCFQGTDTISIDGAPQVSNAAIERVRRG